MKVLSSAASKGAEAASAAKAAAGRAAEAVSKRTEDVMMARRERYIEVKQYLVELKDRSPLFKTSGWDKIHELWRHFFGMKKGRWVGTGFSDGATFLSKPPGS